MKTSANVSVSQHKPPTRVKYSFNDLLVFIWILSLLLQRVSVFGSLSVDNVLSPVLFVILLLTRFRHIRIFNSTNFLFMLIVIVFFLSQLLSLFNNNNALFQHTYSLLTQFLYFSIFFLYINSLADLKKAFTFIIILTSVAAFSAFLVSIGAVTLDFTRISSSRSEYFLAERATGLITNYGDMALLYSLSILLLVNLKYLGIQFVSNKLMLLLVCLFLVSGIVSLQSRNIILSVLLSLMIFYLLYFVLLRHNSNKAVVISLLAPAALVFGFFLFYNFDSGVGAVSNVGGKQALATAQDRLSQYQIAMALVDEHLLLGISGDQFFKYSEFITNTHNMWLRGLLNGGIVSIAILVIYYLVFFSISLRPRNRNRISILVSTFFLVSIFATQFYPGLTPIYWVLIGLCTSAISIRLRAASPIESDRHLRRTEAKMEKRRARQYL